MKFRTFVKLLVLTGAVAACADSSPSRAPVSAETDSLPVAFATPPEEAAFYDSASVLALGAAPDEAMVTLDVYLDFTCKQCVSFWMLSSEALLSEYENSDRVRFEFYDVATYAHPLSYDAALIARCAAAQGQYLSVANDLYRRSRTWSRWEAEQGGDSLKSLVSPLVSDSAALSRCMRVRRPESDSLVTENLKRAQAVKVRALPAFWVRTPLGGTLYTGAFTPAQIAGIVETTLSR